MSEDLFKDRVNEQNQEVHEMLMTDYDYMMNHMHPIPDKEIRTSQYSINHNGTTYHVFNAERVAFGRMCVQIANAIRGKNKPIYRRIDPTNGDKVIVVNAEKMLFVGRKLKFKNLKYHTGRAGGLKTKMLKDIYYTRPELVIFNSVYKMLPKNKTRFVFLENLTIYKGKSNQVQILRKSFFPISYQIRIWK